MSVIGIIVLLGAFIGPTIRKYTPRAAMLGTLAGVSITFIALRPAFQMWETPWIGLVCFAIILLSWVANVRMPFNLPGGLAAVIVGTVLAWGAAALAAVLACRGKWVGGSGPPENFSIKTLQMGGTMID